MTHVRTANAEVAVSRLLKNSKTTSMGQITFGRFFRHRMAVLGVILLSAIILFVLGGSVFIERYANTTALTSKFTPPSTEHPFGTDGVGRNVLAHVIWSRQISLMIGVFSVTISISIGTLVGLINGIF